MKRSICLPLLLAGLLISGMTSVSAQGFEWPETAENLKVLDPATTGEQLGNIMRAFTGALGVRCSHCHVGEGPLTEYDFVSDEKPAKEKTRIMMRMTQAINNQYISSLTYAEPEHQERVSVNCTSCHRNVSKPMFIEEVLMTSHEEGGVEEVLSHYDELRQAYYGGFTYDFRPGTLTRIAQNMAQSGDAPGAITVLQRETSMHENHAEGHFALGNLLAETGQKEEAIASYEKAFELSPPRAQRFIQERIDALTGEQ